MILATACSSLYALPDSSAASSPAKEAIELFCYRAACMIGQLTMAAGGFEALVFTGGIGENSSLIRAKTIGYLAILGLELDEEANEATRFGKAGIITRADRTPCALVVPTNEERMIAFDTRSLSGLESPAA